MAILEALAGKVGAGSGGVVSGCALRCAVEGGGTNEFRL